MTISGFGSTRAAIAETLEGDSVGDPEEEEEEEEEEAFQGFQEAKNPPGADSTIGPEIFVLVVAPGILPAMESSNPPAS